jgi:hypothetical protein
LNFGNSFLNEGETENVYFGGWDTFGEGVKFSVTVQANDLPDISVEGDDSNGCYLYTNPTTGNIEFPTRDDHGNTYSGSHCLKWVLEKGSDDIIDPSDDTKNDKTTLEIYKGTTLDSTPVNNEVLDTNVSDIRWVRN